MVRYADDTVLGFQAQTEADRFLEDLRERLGKFGLELHPDKTRRIEFGRYAELNRQRRGEGKPETFDFLGFTHISGKNRRGYFTVKRQTIGQAPAEEAAGTEAATPAAPARAGGAHGKVAPVGRARLLQLLCGTGEPRPRAYLSDSVDPPVANATAATQPTPPTQLGPHGKARRPLAAGAARAASLAVGAVRRPASELRAVCAKERSYGSVRGVPGNRYPYRDSGNVYENKGSSDNLPDTKDDICAWSHAILHKNTRILQKPTGFFVSIRAPFER